MTKCDRCGFENIHYSTHCINCESKIDWNAKDAKSPKTKRKESIMVGVVLFLIVALAMVVIISGTGQNGQSTAKVDNPLSEITQVKVIITYHGSWKGTVGDIGSSSTYNGTGNNTITINKTNSGLFVVSSVIARDDTRSGTMTVKIVKMDGTVLREGSTMTKQGIVTLSWSSGFS